MEPIGIIYSPYKTKDECPIQPVYASDTIGRVQVSEQYTEGLKDIEDFTHLYLLYQFDRAGKIEMTRPTFLDDESHGIFAMRHPCRPNGIGMSIVKLKKRENNILLVEGIDVLNMTPLLDIKPYIRRFDCIETANEGWMAEKQWAPKPEGRE